MALQRFSKSYPRGESHPGGWVTDLFSDVAGGVDANLLTDQGAAPEGSADVLALSDGTSTATITSGITNPGFPRSLVVAVKANGAGVTFTAANVVVVGTDQFGVAVTENIAIPTGAVAMNQFRLRVGVKVFKTITSVKMDTAQPANAQFSVGIGTLIGLRNKLATAASSDVKAVRKDAAAVSSATYTVDTTYHGIKMGADLADNADLIFEYAAY